MTNYFFLIVFCIPIITGSISDIKKKIFEKTSEVVDFYDFHTKLVPESKGPVLDWFYVESLQSGYSKHCQNLPIKDIISSYSLAEIYVVYSAIHKLLECNHPAKKAKTLLTQINALLDVETIYIEAFFTRSTSKKLRSIQKNKKTPKNKKKPKRHLRTKNKDYCSLLDEAKKCRDQIENLIHDFSIQD